MTALAAFMDVGEKDSVVEREHRGGFPLIPHNNTIIHLFRNPCTLFRSKILELCCEGSGQGFKMVYKILAPGLQCSISGGTCECGAPLLVNNLRKGKLGLASQDAKI